MPENARISGLLTSARLYPARPHDARKGQYGRVIIAGGSNTYAGCLAFNALAALRSGADLAIVVAPQRAADIVACYSTDLITVACRTPFPDPRVVRELSTNADVLIVGCGVERTREAHQSLLTIVRAFNGPIVIDAEALHAIAAAPKTVLGDKSILTPNGGEFEVLSGKPWPRTNRERRKSVKLLAHRYKSTVIVKGAIDYISDGNSVQMDNEGSPYLTKGGYGDLLAGSAAAFLARRLRPFDAARAAAYLVGRAGRLASEKFGEGTLASDALMEIASLTLHVGQKWGHVQSS